MDRQHGFRRVHDFFLRDKSEHVGEARIGCFVAVAATHAAANGEVVAGEPVVFDNGNEADVVRENVSVVARRDGERHLELSRQITFAIERVHEILVHRVVEVELHAFNPNGVIRPGLGSQCIRHPQAIRINLFARLRACGRGRGKRVPAHVTARRKG